MLLLVFSLFPFANCFDAKNTHTNRIVDGFETGLGQFPYQVLIQYHKFPFYLPKCGGALIKPSYVLTAAHCVVDNMQVMAGFIKQYNWKEYRAVEKVTIATKHPNYNSKTLENDIALLKLEHGLPLSYTIGLIKLPQADSIPTGEGLFAGWGSRGFFHIIPSMHLKHSKINIISIDECKSRLGTQSKLLMNSQICGLSKSGIYGIDEGGSLLRNNTTVGIASRRDKNNTLIFTRVSNYISWINGIIGE